MDHSLPITAAPEWVELSHSGLLIEFSPDQRDHWEWLFLLVFTLVLAALTVFAWPTEGITMGWALWVAAVSFMGWITLQHAYELAVRRSLVLTPSGLVIRKTVLARFDRVQHLPLRHAHVRPSILDSAENGKWARTALEIEISEPGSASRTVSFHLPKGKNAQEAIADLHWVVKCLQQANEAARETPESVGDQALQQNLGRLLGRIRAL